MGLPNLIASQRNIKLPDDIKERALMWVQSQAVNAHRSPQEAPFSRLIDFWFAAIAWALQNDLAPVENVRGTKFVSIGPTPQDVKFQNWKLQLLILLAVREFGYEDHKTQDPKEIIELANRYAEAGAESLLTDLETSREFAVPKLYRVTDLFITHNNSAIAGTPMFF